MIPIFINPPQNTPYPQPPLGLASLSAFLEKNNRQVDILDANALNLTIEDIVSQVKGRHIIGITAMTPFVNTAIHIAKKIKLQNPDSTIILGGPHATLLPVETLEMVPEIDIIVKGEGECTIVALITALTDNISLQKIPGIAFRDKIIYDNPCSPPIQDLDELPFLSYNMLLIDRYRFHAPHGKKKRVMAMMTSRGCPFDCIYCSKPVFGKKYRAQSAKRIVDEIEFLITQYDIQEIVFYDDSFTLNKKRILQLCSEIHERGITIDWSCETRVDLIDDELLSAMKTAGCFLIAYGIESGNQVILDNLRKKITLRQIEDAVRKTQSAGIMIVGYFMLGSPGETPATIEETIRFSHILNLDFAQFSLLTPFPGTEIYSKYHTNSLKETVWEDFIYANLTTKTMPILENDSLSREDLQNWNRRAYREFYFNVSYLLKRVLKIRSVGDLMINIKGLFLVFGMHK